MKPNHTVFFLLIFVMVFLAGCGPSPEEIATMTASTWTATPEPTSTPLPTSTPTPIPYDLTFTVVDADGNPISGASVMLAELGEEDEKATQSSDENGQVSWGNLPEEMISLSVQGQGYFSGELSQTIERGANEVKFTLERDPFGLLPSEACAQGEKPLLIEDFQDGKAQGWSNITAALEFNAQNGWALVEDEPGNFVLTASQAANFATDSYFYEGLEPYSNAVWRLRTKIVGNDNDAFLNWRHAGTETGDWRYIIQYGGPAMLDLSRLHYEVGHFSVSGSSFSPQEEQWYLFEISTFGETTEVWVDGEKKNSYTDPQLMEPGTIGLEVHLFDGSNSVYTFDNIVVCEIDSPFETIYVSE